MVDTKFLKQKILPFSLSAVILLADQLSKAFIVKNWPQVGTLIRDVFGNDLLLIYHVRNKVIAFSLGCGVPESLRPLLFVALPVVVLILLCVYYFKDTQCTALQRWAIAGITGGGAGNLIDRVFRPDGVVDFISVKFFGIFGFERWPTFNVSDSAVVVCVIIWFISMITQEAGAAKRKPATGAAAGAEKQG